MMAALLIVSVAVLAYAWGGYPLLLLWLARRRPPARNMAPAETPPRVAILLAAHNESRVIVARLENLAALDYPAERREVFLGVDGATDGTAAAAAAWAAERSGFHVLNFAQRRGKLATLKALVSRATASDRPVAERPDLLVLTDANTRFEPDALRWLTVAFADPNVGGVCGELVFHPVPGGMTAENAYWRWETRLKAAESALDSCLGANGAIYAMRTGAFWTEVPDNVVVDDFVLGMKVREQGRRMLYEPRARAHEELPPAVGHEWRRRVRIGAGAFQALVLCRRCLLPRYGKFAWMFWSHKVLRWFTPHLLLAWLALGTAGLVRGGPWVAVWLGWVALIGTAMGLVGILWSTKGRAAPRPLRAAGYFLAMQAALLAGFLRFCRGGLTGVWERTERPETRWPEGRAR